MPTAKTLTLDRKTNHILLIAAEFAPPPADPPADNPGARLVARWFRALSPFWSLANRADGFLHTQRTRRIWRAIEHTEKRQPSGARDLTI